MRWETAVTTAVTATAVSNGPEGSRCAGSPGDEEIPSGGDAASSGLGGATTGEALLLLLQELRDELRALDGELLHFAVL